MVGLAEASTRGTDVVIVVLTIRVAWGAVLGWKGGIAGSGRGVLGAADRRGTASALAEELSAGTVSLLLGADARRGKASPFRGTVIEVVEEIESVFWYPESSRETDSPFRGMVIDIFEDTESVF